MTALSLDLKCKTALLANGLLRLQVWVDSAVGVPSEIFLVRHLAKSPDSTHSQEIFARGCNYADLLNYDSTGPDDIRQHYRVSKLDLTFTSNKEASEFFTGCQVSAAALIADIKACSDTTPVETTFDCSGVCDLAISTITGGTGKSLKCSLTLTSKGIYTENKFFLVRKLSSAMASAGDNRELIAIASPEDIMTYATTETYPALYRMSTLTFAVGDSAKLTTALTSIKEDLLLATSAFKIPLQVTGEYIVTDTTTNTPLYGV